MEDTRVIKLYEPSPTPCLHVADVQNMVGRVPLIPLFLAGNSTPTIPGMFSRRKDSGFQYCCANAAATDGRLGSNVYEVNPWLWQFGRGKPRLGGWPSKRPQKGRMLWAMHGTIMQQTLSRDNTSSQGGSSLIPSTWCCMIVCTSMYEYIPVYTSMYEYVPVFISIIRGCKYSWSARIYDYGVFIQGVRFPDDETEIWTLSFLIMASMSCGTLSRCTRNRQQIELLSQKRHKTYFQCGWDSSSSTTSNVPMEQLLLS